MKKIIKISLLIMSAATINTMYCAQALLAIGTMMSALTISKTFKKPMKSSNHGNPQLEQHKNFNAWMSDYKELPSNMPAKRAARNPHKNTRKH